MEDTFLPSSPIAAVQFIPVINYLNLLSDFLFIENYLDEVDENKKIPIVNALYEYLAANQYKYFNKVKLIRQLLKGSDMYGEKESEDFDVIFVKTMFDYIISSLVFEKYGNIYGFLAEAIRKEKNFKYNHTLMVIKETLKNAIFENEYGANSKLTDLAVNRIYGDIIFPLFPQPNTNLNLLSIDYIFAQAGLMYLQVGRINATYFPIFYRIYESFGGNNLFNNYLAVGHVIKNLLHRGKIDYLALRVFALPAIFYYVSTEENIRNEEIRNIVFQPRHWKIAYHNLFEFLTNNFYQIEDKLQHDFEHKINLAFTHFQNLASVAQFLTDLECRYWNRTNDKTRINIENTFFNCQSEIVLENIDEWFLNKINNIGEIYGKYDLELIKRSSISKITINDLHNVEITLIYTDINHLKHLSYDIFEFYYTTTDKFDYFALIRENYTCTLIKESDNPELFRDKVHLSLFKLINLGHRVVLKYANVTVNSIELKKNERFKIDFNFYDDNLKKNEWWQKFGLSLISSYPCLLNTTTNQKTEFCEKNNIKFVIKDLDSYSYLTSSDRNIKSVLLSLGTTNDTIFLMELIRKNVDSIFNNSWSEIINYENSTVYDKFSLHIEEPAFVSISTNLSDINLLSTIVDNLEKNLNESFTFVKNMLSIMDLLLENNSTKIISDIYNNSRQILMVKTTKMHNFGYGYKFIKVPETNDTQKIALLRTGYEFKDVIFITSAYDLVKKKNIFTKLNFTTFEYDNQLVYEINNQLRRKSTTIEFFGIYFNKNITLNNCDNYYFSEKIRSDFCFRTWRFIEKSLQKEKEVQLIKNKTRDIVSDQEIRSAFEKFTFLFDNTTALEYFADNWIRNKKFVDSDWSKNYQIENAKLFNKLMYDIVLDKTSLSLAADEYRINSIYTYRERCKIEQGTTLENIINDYNEQKAYYSVTFEDYYAIRNFATTGDRRINGDTNEAKLMKLALYKLAIRQYDAPYDEFQSRLFRIDSVSVEFFNKQLKVGKEVTLQKFTLTSTNAVSAMRFSSYPSSGFRNILYIYNFDGPYFRPIIEMKVDQFEPIQEKKIILFPGSVFNITYISIVTSIGGMGNVYKVVLQSTFNGTGKKNENYKIIMKEITRIQL